MDLALKSIRIVDLCGKSNGLTDFGNTIDGGSAVNFGADSGLCCLHFGILSPNWRNLGHGSLFQPW